MTVEAEIIEPNKGGRQSEFNQEVFDDICDRMSEGKSLREVCKLDGMPNRSTVMRWVKGNEQRKTQYDLARDACYDWIAEEAIRIADDSAGDYFVEDRDGRSIVVPDHARVQRARLQVDTRKWILSKLAPRKYGDKVELLAGASEPASQTVTIGWKSPVRVIVYPMLRADGTVIPQDTPEYDSAIEKAANEARNRGEKETTVGIKLNLPEGDQTPTRQITYQPDPLPGDLTPEDWSLLTEVLNLIRRTIPSDDNSPPETIFRILREALLLHFREVEIERSSGSPEAPQDYHRASVTRPLRARTRGPKFAPIEG